MKRATPPTPRSIKPMPSKNVVIEQIQFETTVALVRKNGKGSTAEFGAPGSSRSGS
jgi:hypothetical protein